MRRASPPPLEPSFPVGLVLPVRPPRPDGTDAPARPVDWSLDEMLPAAFLDASQRGLSLGALGGHALRVAAYAYALGRAYGLPDAACGRLRSAAAFHDIGKSRVPRSVLEKPGPLDAQERRLVERHTVQGSEMLFAADRSDLREAALIALSHHENVDGSGYPYGLPGDCIPLGARLVRVADHFDALTMRRAYRPQVDEAEALSTLEDGRGTLFDPDAVDAFFLALETYPSLGERLRWFTGQSRHPELGSTRHTMHGGLP